MTFVSLTLPVPQGLASVSFSSAKRSSGLSTVHFATPLLPPPSHDIAHQPPDIPLGVLDLSALLPFLTAPCCHFRNCCQRIDSQQHPASSKELITGCCAGRCPYLTYISVGCQWWLLHSLFQNPFKETVLLCWHGDSLPDSADSPKPQALRVPSYRRAGLDRIRSAR
jgi:hypothetical protein